MKKPPSGNPGAVHFPLTHFLRVVRGVMLKDASFAQLSGPLLAMGVFTAVALAIAMLRYRRTLD